MAHRMTITLDEALVDEVCEVLDVRTRSEAIRIALTDVLRRKHLKRALGHRGQMKLDLDSLAKMREGP